MKKTAVAVLLLSLACAAPRPAHASLSGTTKILFSMPSGFDPRRLDIYLLGTPFVTDSGAGNPTPGAPPTGTPMGITGNTLLTGSANGGGLEVHNRTPTNMYIRELDFVTDYTGTLDLDSIVDPSFIGGNYREWGHENQGTHNGLQYFRYYVQSASSTQNPSLPLLSPFDFGLLQATSTNDPAFANSHFGVAGYDTVAPDNSGPRFLGNPFATSVPEASTIVTFGVLVAGGTVCCCVVAALAKRPEIAPVKPPDGAA